MNLSEGRVSEGQVSEGRISERRIYALVAVMILLWSGNYIVAKVALREIPPVLLMALRTAISGLIMIPFAVKEFRKGQMKFTGRNITIWLLLGIGGVTLNQFFFVLGINRTTVSHSSMIIATTPVWVLLIAGILRMELITVPKVTGMGLAIAGVAILQIFRPRVSTGGPTVAGDLLILMAAALFALMTVFGKRLDSKGNSIVVNSFGYIGGALLIAPLGWWTNRSFDLSRISLAGWGGVFYMAAFSSVLCYLIYYWVLQRIPASRIAAFQYLQPVFATIMAVFLLGEDLTFPVVASGSMIFAGVFLTERFG